jgi:hypothetical protein
MYVVHYNDKICNTHHLLSCFHEINADCRQDSYVEPQQQHQQNNNTTLNRANSPGNTANHRQQTQSHKTKHIHTQIG